MTLLDAPASMTPNILGAILGDLITFAISAVFVGGVAWYWRKRRRARAHLAPVKFLVYECGRCGVVMRQRLVEDSPSLSLADAPQGANGSAKSPHEGNPP